MVFVPTFWCLCLLFLPTYKNHTFVLIYIDPDIYNESYMKNYQVNHTHYTIESKTLFRPFIFECLKQKISQILHYVPLYNQAKIYILCTTKIRKINILALEKNDAKNTTKQCLIHYSTILLFPFFFLIIIHLYNFKI